MVRQVCPTILIGTAARAGVFTEEIVQEMAQHAERPIIFPLSNPTSKCEALPADVIAWTSGRAFIATGSPFADVAHNGQTFAIGQCNNMSIFPGIGLGVLASRARRVTNEMFIAAARALSACSPVRQSASASLYPRVAVAVVLAAQSAGVAEQTSPEELERRVAAQMWKPHYPRLRYKADI